MNKKTWIALAVILLFCGQALSQTGTKKKRPLPYEYGQVIINNYSEKADLRPSSSNTGFTARNIPAESVTSTSALR